jgi:hypothetical protein
LLSRNSLQESRFEFWRIVAFLPSWYLRIESQPRGDMLMMIRLSSISLVILAAISFWLLKPPASESRDAGASLDGVTRQPDSTITPSGVLTSTLPIDPCSQHAQICPLEAATWAGEPDAWQITGKKWKHDPNTPIGIGIGIMWEWSEPYSGANPDYIGSRTNPYANFTTMPEAYPLLPGDWSALIYDWERWKDVGGIHRMFQYGAPSEALSNQVGESDCSSGINYPVTDHTSPYAYTSMSVLRNGTCAAGGYVSARLIEPWGEPRSLKRIQMCDNTLNGLPADQSPISSQLCKVSPHVGIVHQRYVFGAGPDPQQSPPVMGCEAAVYAWGWPKPQNAQNTGQDYAPWFRNGEMRLSRWIRVPPFGPGGSVPGPDDPGWNVQCSKAWTGLENWLYTGEYLIGTTVYTDTFDALQKSSIVIPATEPVTFTGLNGAVFTFPANTFTEAVTLTQTVFLQDEFKGVGGGLWGINHLYSLSATYQATGLEADAIQPYTVTLPYAEAAVAPAIEGTLAMYYWDTDRWVKEPTSVEMVDVNTIVATPQRLGQWAVLGNTHSVHLPLVVR